LYSLKQKQVNITDLSEPIEHKICREPSVTGDKETSISKELVEVLKKALVESKKMDDTYISRDHSLLALILQDCQYSVILRQIGINYDDINKIFMQLWKK